jgi:hypothetical protein
MFVGPSSLYGLPTMPLELNDNEMTLLLSLSAPIDQSLRPEFLRAVAVELEARPAAIGEGAIHRMSFAASLSAKPSPLNGCVWIAASRFSCP